MRVRGNGVVRGVALWVVVGCLAAHAHAQDEGHTPPDEAVQLFESARQLYLAGQYGQAREQLEQALVLDPGSPTLVFNLARVSELMGDLDAAIGYAEHYQTLLSPDDLEENASIDSTLSRLRGAREYLALRAQAEQQAAPELRVLAPRVIVRERGIADLPFWVTLGAGGALLVAGAILGGVTLSARGGVNDFVLMFPDDQEVRQARIDRMDRLALATDLMLGIGGAAVVSALLLYVLRVRTYERDAEPEAEAALGLDVVPTRGGGAMVLRGRL